MSHLSYHEYDLIGIGIGPSNLSTAALLAPVNEVKSLFFDNKKEFQWFPGMLFPEATIQVSWLKDLATLVDPTSKYTFLSFLAEKKRIYRFAMARFPRVKRSEFNQYFSWVSQSLSNLCFDTMVEEINFHKDLFTIKYAKGQSHSKNIVVASGLTAQIPEQARPYLSSSVFHASQYINENVFPAGKRILIIGGGQSGAEIFNRLVSNKRELPAELCWVSRRSNFLPIDDSPFTNEFFTPTYSEYFYMLPEQEKKNLISQQILASDGIHLDLLEEIYRKLYEIDLIDGEKKAKLFFNYDMIGFEKTVNSYNAYFRNMSTGSTTKLDADIVIFATGFKYKPPEFLTPLLEKMRTCDNNFVINDDFSVQWDGPHENRIYIQNGARHVRGVADPNLSLVAWRSAKIINSLVGRNIYNIDNESSVFNWQEYLTGNDINLEKLLDPMSLNQ